MRSLPKNVHEKSPKNVHEMSPNKKTSRGQKCPWNVTKSVQEMSPILFTRYHLLCLWDVGHPVELAQAKKMWPGSGPSTSDQTNKWNIKNCTFITISRGYAQCAVATWLHVFRFILTGVELAQAKKMWPGSGPSTPFILLLLKNIHFMFFSAQPRNKSFCLMSMVIVSFYEVSRLMWGLGTHFLGIPKGNHTQCFGQNPLDP